MQDKKYTEEDLIGIKSKALVSIFTLHGITLIYNILQTVASLILVRLLEPEHFGLFAPLFALFNFFTLVIIMGQGPLFVRKKNYPAGHFIQIIAINAIIGVTILELVSGTLSFIHPQAPQMGRILFLGLLPACINMGFIYLAMKRLERYRLFLAWMLDVISFGLSAVFFALNNYGTYSFIYAIIISRILFFTAAFFIYKAEILSAYLMKIRQYFNYLKEGFAFNLSYLTGPLSDQADRVILTKFISLGELGLYSIAVKYSNLFSNFVLANMESIAYPLYSKFTDDIERIKKIYHSFTKMAFALLIPINSFVFVFSKDIVRIVAGEKWIGAAPLISIFSFLYLVKFARYFGYQILWASKKETISLIQLITRAVLFLSTGIILSFKYQVYGFIIAYFLQGFYDSVFYYFALKDLRPQIRKTTIFIISLFIPIFIALNIVGRISNFYAGILATVVIYLLFLKFLFTPFIESQFSLKIDKFFPYLIKRLSEHK